MIIENTVCVPKFFYTQVFPKSLRNMAILKLDDSFVKEPGSPVSNSRITLAIFRSEGMMNKNECQRLNNRNPDFFDKGGANFIMTRS